MTRRLRAWPDALPWLVALALAVYAAVWFSVALSRIVYPFDLDFLEDDIIVEAWRMAQGLPVFVPLNGDFVPHAYGPLYMLLAAGLLKFSGPAYLPMRMLSFVATLCSCGLLAWAGYRASRRLAAALLAPGLFFAGYALTGSQYELARVDSLFIAFVLAGTLAGITGAGSQHGRVLAALCLALAFFAKQSALVFGLGMAVYIIVVQRRRAIDFTLVYLAAVTLPLIAFDRLTAGWSTFYLLVVPQGDPLTLGRIVDYVRHDLLLDLGPLCALFAALVVLRMRGMAAQSTLSRDWPLFALLAVITSGWMRARLGGNLNSLLPAYTFLCLIPVLLYADLARALGVIHSSRAPTAMPRRTGDVDRRELPLRHELDPRVSTIGQRTETFATVRAFVLLAVLWQVALAVYNPQREIPSAAMRESEQRLIERLRQTSGPVLVLEHPFYALLAGKEPGVALTALWHARIHGELPLPSDLIDRIRNRTYALVISDDGEYPEVAADIDALLNNTYRQMPQLNVNESPPTLNGLVVRPRFVYAPGE